MVVVEVHNTHGERHLYTLRPRSHGPTFVASMEKAFYVSPFTRRSVTRSGSATRRRACGSPSTTSCATACAAHKPGSRPATSHRAKPPADAAAESARDAQDHADDPLARTASVAPRGTLPPTSRGRLRNECPHHHHPGSVVLGTVLERVAWRVGLAAAARIRAGRLTVVLPDGSRQVYGDEAASEQAEIHIHDHQALVRMLVRGETGGGEAYMDGLWSSPDPGPASPGGAQPRVPRALGRMDPLPGPARPDVGPSVPAEHPRRQPPEHRGPLRPGE